VRHYFSAIDIASISEISPASERGMLMSGYQTVLQFCALLGFWGAFASHAIFAESSAFQWELPVSIQLLPGIFLLLGTLLVPETPRFLAERGRFKAAERSLAWLRSMPTGHLELSREMDEICEAADVSKALLRNQRSFLKEASASGVLQRLVVGVGLMIAQNMVGLNALNYCESKGFSP
jgi:MFS family permease